MFKYMEALLPMAVGRCPSVKVALREFLLPVLFLPYSSLPFSNWLQSPALIHEQVYRLLPY